MSQVYLHTVFHYEPFASSLYYLPRDKPLWYLVGQIHIYIQFLGLISVFVSYKSVLVCWGGQLYGRSRRSLMLVKV